MIRKAILKGVEVLAYSVGVVLLARLSQQDYAAALAAVPILAVALPEQLDLATRLPVIFVWVIFATLLIEGVRGFFFPPAVDAPLYLKVARYASGVIHTVIRDAHEKGVPETLTGSAAHEEAIRRILRAMRQALVEEYRRGNVGVTLMVKEKPTRLDEERLCIRFWSNETEAPPRSYHEGFGFPKGTGFAGKAWAKGRALAGQDRYLGFVRDRRYVVTPDSVDGSRCFLCVPLTDQGSTPNPDYVIGVLNFDAKEPRYFPVLTPRRLSKIVRALDPLIMALEFHLACWLSLRDESRNVPQASVMEQ